MTVARIDVGQIPDEAFHPQQATYDPVNGDIYVWGYYGAPGPVVVISGTKLAGWVNVSCWGPCATVVDSANGAVYATTGTDNVTLIEGTTPIRSVDIGRAVGEGAYDAKNGFVYFGSYAYASRGAHNVTVLNGTTVVGSVDVGSQPGPPCYDPANGYVYVPNANGSNVSVLDGTRLVASIAVGTDPVEVACNGANGYAYVSNALSNNVSVIDGTALLGSVRVGNAPDAEVIASRTGYDYVVNDASNNLTVLNGTKLIKSVAVGTGPHYSVYDDQNGFVYVSNEGSNNLTVTFPSFAIAFTESGLEAGTNWSVTLSAASPRFIVEVATAVTRWSNGATSVEFKVSEGNYTYTATTLTNPGYGGYFAGPGSVSVPGTSMTVTLAFQPGSGPPGTSSLPGWAWPVGLALVAIGAVGLSVTVYRYRARESARNRVAVARMFATDWRTDENGDPAPRTRR
jgi:DNA-binding beta-propeller fold protein YncE